MPLCFADVQVSVATAIIEVFSAQAGGDVVDVRVVEECAEVLALVHEGHDHRARTAVVRSAVRFPDGFKFRRDAVNALMQAPW